MTCCRYSAVHNNAACETTADVVTEQIQREYVQFTRDKHEANQITG